MGILIRNDIVTNEIGEAIIENLDKGIYKLVEVKSKEGHVLNLDKIFKKSQIEKIFLNFSDPWPKKKHTKRRLTYEDFLNTYNLASLPLPYILLPVVEAPTALLLFVNIPSLLRVPWKNWVKF